jgi:hypothetical protein
MSLILINRHRAFKIWIGPQAPVPEGLIRRPHLITFDFAQISSP